MADGRESGEEGEAPAVLWSSPSPSCSPEPAWSSHLQCQPSACEWTGTAKGAVGRSKASAALALEAATGLGDVPASPPLLPPPRAAVLCHAGLQGEETGRALREHRGGGGSPGGVRQRLVARQVSWGGPALQTRTGLEGARGASPRTAPDASSVPPPPGDPFPGACLLPAGILLVSLSESPANQMPGTGLSRGSAEAASGACSAGSLLSGSSLHSKSVVSEP